MCLLVVVLFGALAPDHAAAAAPQEQGDGPRLLSAEISVDIKDRAEAEVSAFFRLAGGGEVTVLLADLPGQRLEQLQFHIDGESVPFTEERRSSAIRALRARVDAGGVVAIGYRLRSEAPAHYRFALPVPEATPTGEERSIQLTVRLPDGARFMGNSFPPLLASAAGELSAATLAVPAQAHIVFGQAGLELWAHKILEWAALGAAMLLILGGWIWNRRATGNRPGESQ